ncbi:MAG: hypothetical protein A2Y56_07545 [Candidatus Aminicenantes bacterium RBG_13_63_10]|nr:MAG: hypothetical protein A2Y56_07545 [Candidatus Aminicenantes bacterium RBG_13_63_10]
MRAPCFRRTQPHPSGGEARPAGRRGAATFVVLALFVVFSSLGLGLIFLSQVSLRSGRSVKNLTVLDILAENGVKQEYAALAALLETRPFPLTLDALQAEAWLSDPAANEKEIIETALGTETPTSSSGGWGAHAWRGTSEFSIGGAESGDSHLEADFRVLISSLGNIEGLSVTRSSRLEAALKITAGFVPLAFFPVLLDEAAGDGAPPEPPSSERLVITPGPGLNHLARILETRERLLPAFAAPALEKALGVKILKPQDLTPAFLRTVLGLEVSPDPVPEGVYLVRHDSGIGGVYVQGDLRELIAAIEEDFQVLCFRSGESEYTLKFSPRRGRTEFSGPLGGETFDSLPQPVVIVDGKIEALGGGRPDGTGALRLCPEEEIPSILGGVRLTIVSSGPVTIASHLIHQGVTWESGIPSLKESRSELVIFAGGMSGQSGAVPEGGLFIGADAPGELKIQAELAAAGAGFRLLGPAKNIDLLGTLQASSIRLGESRLEVHYDPGPLGGEDSAARLLRTESPVLIVTSLKPRAWRDDE